MVCARQIDFSSDGQPITPRGVDLLASEKVLTELRAKQYGQFSRLNTPTLRAGSKCDGYDASCPDGKTCTGTYIPGNCEFNCDITNNQKWSVCAQGDVQLDWKKDCGRSNWYNAIFSLGIDGSCDGSPICGAYIYIYTCGLDFRTFILGARFWLR